MGPTRKYFRNQFRWRMFNLDHDDPVDFYVSCWQQNRNALPLLLLRLFLFLFCVAIIIASIVLNAQFGVLSYWLIYLTHWGLLLITLATGSATLVSAYAYFGKPIDTSLGFPWHMKLFWLSYNMAVTIAFLVTIFYWSFLSQMVDVEYAQNFTLDFMIHGMNSIIMLLLLLTSRVPCRIVHVYQPICLALLYTLFTVIYYYAGGTDSFGNEWVYPMMDWSSPGATTVMIFGVALLLLVIHAAVVALTVTKDVLTKRQSNQAGSFDISSS